MILDTERMRLPAMPQMARRPGIPVIAVVAPVLMAGVLWAMTSSPFALVFAFLGPVIAIASWAESRRNHRRDRRAALADVRRRLDQLGAAIESRADARRSALERLSSAPPRGRSDDRDPPPIVLRLGAGDIPSGIEFDATDAPVDPELAEVVAELTSRAATIPDAPVLLEERDADLVVQGTDVVVRAFLRSLLVHALASCPIDNAVVKVPVLESWMRDLPHEVAQADALEVRVGDRRLLRVEHAPAAVAGRLTIRLTDAHGSRPRIDGPQPVEAFRPALMSAHSARAVARDIAARARTEGWRPASALPETIEFATLASADPAAGLVAIVGVDADGPLALDLDRDGPHALVAGTTGSGKSELLVTWVLALARERPPRELGFLLIDFKGGASFAPLRVLPHVVGMVSDLDPAAAARAVESLRAELRRREELLARHGARSFVEMPRGAMSRLVIVVDEFAALVSLDSGLQAVFADLAARGRSLGLHLIVCTQRPAGVVRESVLANVTLRVCLRVLDAADSTAVVGNAGAARLPVEPRGRGLLAGQGARAVQFAISRSTDAEAVASRWASHPRAEGRPWLDPLPGRLEAAELSGFASELRSEGAAVGAVDLPDHQRQELLTIDPWGSGALLVLGAAGAGRSTALDMLEQSVEAAVRRVSDDPAELWQALTLPTGGERVLVIADDLDRTLAWADAEVRAELTDVIAKAARDTRRTGVAIAASARSAGGSMHGVQTSFEQRVVLRLASREEHLLAGAELASYRADRGPGSCVWRGAEAQVALPSQPRQPEWHAPLPRLDLRVGRWAIAASRPADAAHLAADDVVVSDVDGWLSDHLALASARREGRLVLIGCTPSDHRTLTRSRGPLPPLVGDGDAWYFDGATTSRVRVTPSEASGETQR